MQEQFSSIIDVSSSVNVSSDSSYKNTRSIPVLYFCPNYNSLLLTVTSYEQSVLMHGRRSIRCHTSHWLRPDLRRTSSEQQYKLECKYPSAAKYTAPLHTASDWTTIKIGKPATVDHRQVLMSITWTLSLHPTTTTTWFAVVATKGHRLLVDIGGVAFYPPPWGPIPAEAVKSMTTWTR